MLRLRDKGDRQDGSPKLVARKEVLSGGHRPPIYDGLIGSASCGSSALLDTQRWAVPYTTPKCAGVTCLRSLPDALSSRSATNLRTIKKPEPEGAGFNDPTERLSPATTAIPVAAAHSLAPALPGRPAAVPVPDSALTFLWQSPHQQCATGLQRCSLQRSPGSPW